MTSIESTPFEFMMKWTPRAIAVAIGGYYGLGIAYDYGLMAVIDKIAIDVIKHFAGYAGVGALMPTVQWHAAWVVRVIIGLSFGFIYDRIEVLVSTTSKFVQSYFSSGNISCC